MELQQQDKITSKRSDWCKALSFYSDDQKICKNCLAIKNQLSHFILPLDKAVKKLENIHIKDFSKALSLRNLPIIFRKPDFDGQKASLIYLEPEANITSLMGSLSFNEKMDKPFATIVSPNHFAKSKRENETSFVKEIQKYFDPIGFIKFSLNNMEELITYALAESCEMLILPLSKLTEYLEVISAHPEISTLPASFYPYTLSKSHQKA